MIERNAQPQEEADAETPEQMQRTIAALGPSGSLTEQSSQRFIPRGSDMPYSDRAAHLAAALNLAASLQVATTFADDRSPNLFLGYEVEAARRDDPSYRDYLTEDRVLAANMRIFAAAERREAVVQLQRPAWWQFWKWHKR